MFIKLLDQSVNSNRETILFWSRKFSGGQSIFDKMFQFGGKAGEPLFSQRLQSLSGTTITGFN